MAPRAAKRQKVAAADSDEDFVDAPRQRQASGRRPPATRSRQSATMLDEYEADEGRASSKAFLQHANLLDRTVKGNKKGAQGFIAGLEAKTAQASDQLTLALEEMEGDLEKMHSDLVDQIEQTCTDLGVGLEKEDMQLFRQGEELAKLCRDAMKLHERVNQQSTTQPLKTPRLLWDSDRDHLTKVLQRGRDHAAEVIAGLVVPRAAHTALKEGKSHRASTETEDLAVELVRNGHASLRRETWGEVVTSIHRACNILTASTSVNGSVPP